MLYCCFVMINIHICIILCNIFVILMFLQVHVLCVCFVYRYVYMPVTGKYSVSLAERDASYEYIFMSEFARV